MRTQTFNILRPCFVLFVLLSIASVGKSQNASDILVYTKGGVYFNGKLLSEDSTKIEMLLNEKDTFMLPKFMVRRVKRGDDYLIFDNGRTHRIKGYYFGANLGFQIGGSGTVGAIELLFGYRPTKRTILSIGVGSETNTAKVSGFTVDTQFASIFAHGRFYLTNTRRRLFTYARVGFGMGADNEFDNSTHSGGFQSQAGIGIHFARKRHTTFLMTFGYYIQEAAGTQLYLDDFGNQIKVDYDLWMQRLVFKFGWQFN